MEIISLLQHLCYEERFWELGLPSLQNRKLCIGLLAALRYVNGPYDQKGDHRLTVIG